VASSLLFGDDFYAILNFNNISLHTYTSIDILSFFAGGWYPMVRILVLGSYLLTQLFVAWTFLYAKTHGRSHPAAFRRVGISSCISILAAATVAIMFRWAPPLITIPPYALIAFGTLSPPSSELYLAFTAAFGKKIIFILPNR
jgi:hypothetical protein